MASQQYCHTFCLKVGEESSLPEPYCFFFFVLGWGWSGCAQQLVKFLEKRAMPWLPIRRSIPATVAENHRCQCDMVATPQTPSPRPRSISKVCVILVALLSEPSQKLISLLLCENREPKLHFQLELSMHNLCSRFRKVLV